MQEAFTKLDGWQLVVVVCVFMICLTSLFIGKWPWNRRD